MNKVAVIILNWNGEKLLREYLPSVIETTDTSIADIIVADNGSTDSSIELLRDKFPQVTLLKFSENYGFAEGYNRAIKETNYPYTILLNSDVATICTGMAASMAAVLLVAGKEGKRSALTHSRVMIHQPMGGAQGQASDIEITAREIAKLKKELYNIIAEHSHTEFDKVWADSDRDYWMTAQEAKEYGMIDEVLCRKP